jgi:hypothetical protein
MGVGIEAIKHEYFLMLLQMCFYFCTAAIALYFSARHNARKVLKDIPISE